MVTKAADSVRVTRVLLYCCLLFVGSVFAAEFEPEITLGISYTDNLTLVPDNEPDETIYRAEPAFRFSHESQRFVVDADYLMQAFRYADLGRSEVYHQYDASVTAALIPETFFFEVGGSRTQSILDAELNIPRGNLPISGNRQDRDEYYVSPYFQYVLGSTVSVRGSYRNSWLDYSRDEAQGAENRDAQFSIDNYRGGRGITWALDYTWRRSEYDEAIPWENQRASAELGFWVASGTRVFVSGGKESAWDAPLDPALEDDFWEAGFAHRVGERLSAEFAVGERSFGSSWRGNVEVTFQRGSTTLSYEETPTTQARNPFRGGDFSDELAPEDFLNRPGTTDRFIQERLEWRLDFNLPRTEFGVSVFSDNRSERTTAAGDPLPDEEQRGVRVLATYQVGARTDVSVGADWTRRELGDDRSSDLLGAGIAVDYELGARTTVSLQYEYAEEDPDGTSVARDYVANTISLLLTRTF